MKLQQKLDMRIMGIISTFDKITRIHAVDFLESKSHLTFLVNENSAKKAVGKNGANIKRLSYLLKQKVVILELSKNPKKFVTSLIYPLVPESIEQTENVLKIKLNSKEEKARVIGRGASKISFINNLLKRHYNLILKII
ncbi:MAG: hypothetical protein Q8Q42_03935 [Nanoarchaeota archaeon]|nr:hypothetical protein [Nanoarchaeota archaeon]